MFEGPFKVKEEQATSLEEINGAITPRSFQVFVQWVCLGRVVFGGCVLDIANTTAIEFARLVDMCRITSMESLMTEHIKTIILASPAPEDAKWDDWRAPDTITHRFTPQHITSAVALSEEHSARAILAATTIEGCLRRHNYKTEKL